MQADETKVGVLLPEMDRLLRKLMVKFVPLRFIRGQQDLRTVEFTLLDNQHSDDTIAIGMPARAFLATEDLEPAQTAKFFRFVKCLNVIAVIFEDNMPNINKSALIKLLPKAKQWYVQ